MYINGALCTKKLGENHIKCIYIIKKCKKNKVKNRKKYNIMIIYKIIRAT